MRCTRRSVLGGLAGAGMVCLAGRALQTAHDDQIRLENLRSASVSLDITAVAVGSGGVVLDRSVLLAPGDVGYIPDPARAGRETTPVRIDVTPPTT